MKIARFVFQNPKTIFDKCILYLPVKNAKYSDYYQANPVLKMVSGNIQAAYRTSPGQDI